MEIVGEAPDAFGEPHKISGRSKPTAIEIMTTPYHAYSGHNCPQLASTSMFRRWGLCNVGTVHFAHWPEDHDTRMGNLENFSQALWR